MKQHEVRKAAIDAGHKFYEGRPCSRCGGTRRYASVGKCVGCTIERSLAHYHGTKPDAEQGVES